MCWAVFRSKPATFYTILIKIGICYVVGRGRENGSPIVRNAILALSDKWLLLDTCPMDEQIIISQIRFIHFGQVDIWLRTTVDVMLLVWRMSASQISRQTLVGLRLVIIQSGWSVFCDACAIYVSSSCSAAAKRSPGRQMRPIKRSGDPDITGLTGNPRISFAKVHVRSPRRCSHVWHVVIKIYMFFFSIFLCWTTQNFCGPPSVPTGWSAGPPRIFH